MLYDQSPLFNRKLKTGVFCLKYFLGESTCAYPKLKRSRNYTKKQLGSSG